MNKKLSCLVVLLIGSLLLPTQGLAYNIIELPDIYNSFRLEEEHQLSYPEAYWTPDHEMQPQYTDRPYMIYREGNSVRLRQDDDNIVSWVGRMWESSDNDWAGCESHLFKKYPIEDIIGIDGKPWPAHEAFMESFTKVRERLINQFEVKRGVIAAVPPMEAYPKVPAPGKTQITMYAHFKSGSIWTADTARPLFMNTAPKIYSDVPFIPLRDALTPLGAIVGWDPAIQAVHVKANGHEMALWSDKQVIYVDGQEIDLGVAPVIEDGVTMVPVKIVEYLGYTLDYFAGWESDWSSLPGGVKHFEHVQRISITN